MASNGSFEDGVIHPFLQENGSDAPIPRKVRVKVAEHYNMDPDSSGARMRCSRSRSRFTGGETKGTSRNKKEEPVMVFSAAGPDGRILDIDQYCDYYNLPRNDVKSYKLVTHTAIPYYNVQFNEKKVDSIFDPEHFREILLEEDLKPPKEWAGIATGDKFVRAVYTDVHVGMDPQPETSINGQDWAEQDIMDTWWWMINIIKSKGGKDKTLIIDDLGDFLDGQDGKTSRGGHALPQKMSNKECWKLGFQMRKILIKECSKEYGKLIMNIVTDDNHSHTFGWTVSQGIKELVDVWDLSNIEVNVINKFIDHYTIGPHTFILSHGKDAVDMKKGMGVIPSREVCKIIEDYMDVHQIGHAGRSVRFCKGDTHLGVQDMASSKKFTFLSYPALSPPSRYIQLNYQGQARRGFFLEEFDSKNREMSTTPYFI